MEPVGEGTNFLRERPYPVPDRIQTATDFLGIRGQLPLELLRINLKECEFLADVVMQFACDAPPLLLLGGKQAARKGPKFTLGSIKRLRCTVDGSGQLITLG